MPQTEQAVEQVLVLVKPDGVARGLIGQVISRAEARGYKVVRLSLCQATPALLAEHYAEHVAKPFYPSLVQYMTSGPVVALVLEGAQVIAAFRTMAGATDPIKAAPGTIRGDFGRDWGTGEIQNIVHASDSPASAAREIAIWFPDPWSSQPEEEE
ncbi:MAG: nucleoside-diphosphate kinase [Bifidobacteriaceae bacterium]|jgi:nucleoside-diphosphate kinase|nr:nucleoside-diphosphate kinase [Bifidobacteriaceae bacterium]